MCYSVLSLHIACTNTEQEPDEIINSNEVSETKLPDITATFIPGNGVTGKISWANCSQSDNKSWGYDHLLSSPNDTISIPVEANNYYDLRCVDEGGRVFFKWDVFVEEEGFEWQVQPSDDDDFKYFSFLADDDKCVAFITITTAPGCGVLSKIVTTHDFGFEDISVEHLNGQFIQPNDEFTFRVRTHTRYDIMVENTYGEQAFHRTVDVDEYGFNWRVSDRSLQ